MKGYLFTFIWIISNSFYFHHILFKLLTKYFKPYLHLQTFHLPYFSFLLPIYIPCFCLNHVLLDLWLSSIWPTACLQTALYVDITQKTLFLRSIMKSSHFDWNKFNSELQNVRVALTSAIFVFKNVRRVKKQSW